MIYLFYLTFTFIAGIGAYMRSGNWILFVIAPVYIPFTIGVVLTDYCIRKFSDDQVGI